MSLLSERGGPQGPPPSLAGSEVLVDATHPELCKVKGVMFDGRKRFLTTQFPPEVFPNVVEALAVTMAKRHGEARGRAAATDVTTPLASNWYTFELLVEFDRAICAVLAQQHPHILALMGAASAEYGIGQVYRILDTKELLGFLQGIALFHDCYQKYGRTECVATTRGMQMRYHDYICYSPVFCASAIGFFQEAILRHGGRTPIVRETKCHCRGDRICTYDLEWS